jgi:hypothetical protein
MRHKLSEAEFDEIIESLHWSRRNGGDGFGGFYEDLLDFHLKRRTLPSSRVPAQPEEEEQPRGRRERG